MKLTVDGRDDFPVDHASRSLADILYDVSEVLQGERRAILAVVVDGNSIRPEGLALEFADKTTQDVTALEIRSEPVVDLVEESLRDLEEVLPELPEACRGLSELFHGGDNEDGVQKFEQLSTIWHVVRERQLQILHALRLDADHVKIEGKTFAEIETSLSDILTKAADALAANDFITLSDLLHYELCPLAELELVVTKLFRQKLEALGAGG